MAESSVHHPMKGCMCSAPSCGDMLSYHSRAPALSELASFQEDTIECA